MYAKGDGGADTAYAKGGASLPRRENWSKGDSDDGKFKAGGKKSDWKQDALSEERGVHPKLKPNTRTDNEAPERLGEFLGGGDRFTSQNFAEQGEPASMQRTKPDEDWSKEHVPPKTDMRFGDRKSEKAVTPRGGGVRHSSVKGG